MIGKNPDLPKFENPNFPKSESAFNKDPDSGYISYYFLLKRFEERRKTKQAILPARKYYTFCYNSVFLPSLCVQL